MRLSEHEVQVFYYCVADVIRGRQRRYQPIPEWMRHAYAKLDYHIRMTSRQRHGSDDAEGQLEADSWIGSRQTAAILGWDIRRVQRCASDLDGRKISNRLMFRESKVLEYAEGLRDGWSTGCA
jgi:hypothetical protein